MTRLICGVLRLDGQIADGGVVRRMLSVMTPSGRPYSWDFDAIGRFAAGVLSIGPTSGVKPETSYVIRKESMLAVCDARLYSRTNKPAQALPDIIAAGAFASVNGDFAIARWDETDNVLLLARDHFGVRPLQYAVKPGEFVAFASLPSALIASGLVDPRLDDEAVASFPISGQTPPHRTAFASVRKVEAAHEVRIGLDGIVRSKRYWRIDCNRSNMLAMSMADAASELRSHIVAAVERRLPSSGTVAGHLSGGLDSSAVSIVAAQKLKLEGRRYLACSFQEDPSSWDVPFSDEAPYVRSVLQAAPNIDMVAIPAMRPLERLQSGVDPYTMLNTSPREPEQIALAEAAQQESGIMLSGWGGDQVVTYMGRGLEAELLRFGLWRELCAAVRIRSDEQGKSFWRVFVSLALLPQMPRLATFYFHQRSPLPLQVSFVAPAWRKRLVRDIRPIPPNSLEGRRNELEAWWIQNRLEMFAQLGAPYGISYTYPMLDLDLVEFASRLPGSMFRHGSCQRALFRQAMRGIVPDLILDKQEKLAAYPLLPYMFAKDRGAIAAQFETLGGNHLARRYLDVDAIVASLLGEASEETIRSMLRLRDQSCDSAYGQFDEVIQLLPFLAHWAAHQATKPGEPIE